MRSSTKFGRFLERFDLALRRVSGFVFALMGLAWIGTLLEGIRSSNVSEMIFAALSMASFIGLGWLYLIGPLSGTVRRRR
jgi:hypothetical protein